MRLTLFPAITLFITITQAAALKARDKSDYISSCGQSWMPVDDVRIYNDAITRPGFNTAVDYFCSKAASQTVRKDKYLSMATRVWLSYGGWGNTTGINGNVLFEIHNNRDTAHAVNEKDCKDHLKTLSTPGKKCYGPDHLDTSGGTFQVGTQDISYHGFASKVPSTFDSLDKIVLLDTGISPLPTGKEVDENIYINGQKQTIDHGNNNTLDPFPTYTFNDITPIPCHSHNDEWRDYSLYSALSAGCISVEADVHVHNEKLTVGHEDPGDTGPTLQDLYLNPLKKLLDERGTVFPKFPQQDLVLLVDFKSDADKTWDVLVSALTPLRDAGYLSHYNGGFKKGKITVVATGNAIANADTDAPSPLAKALDAKTNPQRAIFMDARIDKDLRNFDATNSYYASAKWSDAVPGGLPITGESLVRLKAARAKGLKVRYWDGPGKERWQELRDQGVDRINVDDLQDVAGMDWGLKEA